MIFKFNYQFLTSVISYQLSVIREIKAVVR
jgi:hypothetical protein